jgi:hypothetical protein
MATLLLHNPWVQFYVLYVAALSVALCWDCWRRAVVHNRCHSVSLARTRAGAQSWKQSASSAARCDRRLDSTNRRE